MKKLIFTSLLALSLGLVGCSNSPSKSDLESELTRAYNEISSLNQEILGLENTINVLSGGTDGAISSIDITSVNSGVLSSLNGIVLFPTELAYPGVVQAGNESSVNLSNTISITPSSNWLMTLGGTTSTYIHQSGVKGTITLGQADDMLKVWELEEQALQPFIDSLNTISTTTGRIFLSSVEKGVTAKISTIIDSTPYVVKTGTLGHNGNILTFMFYYEGDENATKDENIISLLRTIRFGTQDLSIE